MYSQYFFYLCLNKYKQVWNLTINQKIKYRVKKDSRNTFDEAIL